MPFINEKIASEDAVKYNLEAIDRNFIVGGTAERMWTVDRARNIYLRNVSRGREEYKSHSGWTFHWGNRLMYLEIQILDAGGKSGGPCWAHKKLLRLELPKELERQRDDVLFDLQEAFVAYKDFGVYSVSTEYTLIFDK